MKQKVLTICCAILVFLLALGVTLYPLIANWHNQRYQSQIHTQYMELVAQTDDSDLELAKAGAAVYNASIVPGTQLLGGFSQEALRQASTDYENLLNLAGDGIMGYVQIPMIQVHLPIYHGTDSQTLEVGIGHLLGTSLPIGGESTHTVLTAHSGMASQKLFSDLDQLSEGDVFCLQVLGQTLAYQVDAIHTVLPHDTTYLGITEGEDQCTLVTCTPFGVNTHRLLVRGSRIPYEEAEQIVEEQLQEEAPPASTWEQQYIKGLFWGFGAVAVLGLLYLLFRLTKRRRHEAA